MEAAVEEDVEGVAGAYESGVIGEECDFFAS